MIFYTRLLLALCGSLLTTATRIQAFQPALPPLALRKPATATQNHWTPHSSPTTAMNALAIEGATSAVESFFQTQPYLSAFLTCSFKASAADILVQQQQTNPHNQEPVPVAQDDEEDKDWDLSRTLAFLLYGGMYQGIAQQFMYSNIFPDLFGNGQTFQSVAMQVGFDMMFIGPFLCLPVAYAVKSAFTGQEDGFQEKLQSGLDKYMEDVMDRGLLLKYWAIWTPVQFLTFGVIPQHFRVAFVAAVSFFWVTILSSISAATTDSQQEKLAMPVAEEENSTSFSFRAN